MSENERECKGKMKRQWWWLWFWSLVTGRAFNLRTHPAITSVCVFQDIHFQNPHVRVSTGQTDDNDEAISGCSPDIEMLPHHHVGSSVTQHDQWVVWLSSHTNEWDQLTAACLRLLRRESDFSPPRICEFVSRCFADVAAASHQSPACVPCPVMSCLLRGLFWGRGNLSKAGSHYRYNTNHSPSYQWLKGHLWVQ